LRGRHQKRANPLVGEEAPKGEQKGMTERGRILPQERLEKPGSKVFLECSGEGYSRREAADKVTSARGRGVMLGKRLR